MILCGKMHTLLGVMRVHVGKDVRSWQRAVRKHGASQCKERERRRWSTRVFVRTPSDDDERFRNNALARKMGEREKGEK